MSKRVSYFLAVFIFSALPLFSKGPKTVLKDRIAAAEKIYLIPLPFKALEALLEVKEPPAQGSDPMKSGLAGRTVAEYRVEISTASAFENFNGILLGKLNELLGGKVTPAPETFAQKKNSINGEYLDYEPEKMDCSFYVVAEIEKPFQKRELLYKVSGQDYPQNTAMISPGFFNLWVVLYEKEKEGKKGKKVFASGGPLLRHELKSKKLSHAEGGVSIHGGYQTDSFSWAGEY